MMDAHTVNLSLNKKLKLMNNKFPVKKLSRSSLHKIQKNILGFSYKRISKYRPHITKQNKHILSKIIFIDKYLSLLEDQSGEIIIVDGKKPHLTSHFFTLPLEAGFGTSSFRKYGNIQYNLFVCLILLRLFPNWRTMLIREIEINP